MRRHAKASTAGSTQRQAIGLGRIFRGAMTGRDASLRAKGSSAPRARRLALPLTLLAAALSLALGVGSASAVAPTITSTTVSAVTSKAALLEAEINPEGEATTYHFEYGTADCSSNPCTSAPIPNGNVGSGSSAVKVTREVEGLNPGTTYHFRVVANNGSGPSAGPNHAFTTYATPAPNTNCPNQAFRSGPSANLPDCRVYEMVSPVDKNGGDIVNVNLVPVRPSYNRSAADGGKFTFSGGTSFAGNPSNRNASQYLATRGGEGWTTQGIDAPLGRSLLGIENQQTFLSAFKLFTPDLSTAWFTDQNVTPLTPDAGEGYVNVYRRDNLGGYQALTTTTPSNAAEYYLPVIQGHSADFSHVVFAAQGKLTPDAAASGATQLYDYVGGQLHLVSVLPDGTPSVGNAGMNLNIRSAEFSGIVSHAVSDDGSRIFWTGIGSNIYVRENPGQLQSALNGSGECTEPAKACTTNPGVGQYWTASDDGSKLVYSNGSYGQIENGNTTLYESDVDTQTSTPIAGQAYGVLGASDDASSIYFSSKEVLDAGATAGQPNLYLDREGTIGFIGTLATSDVGTRVVEVLGLPQEPTVDSVAALSHASRVSPDGNHLAFESTSPSLAALSGYDNTDAVNGKADMEVYLYDATANGGAGRLSCVSCNHSGASPVGQQLHFAYATIPTENSQFQQTKFWAAAWIQTGVHTNYQSHLLADDGNRLFFNSFDALVPQDTNGVQDVYQWEAPGSADCTEGGPSFSARNDGCISLISTGSSAQRSEFVDATPDGSEVFFETSSSIDPRDPGLLDIYDARVNGGFPVPPAPQACEGDGCQSAPPPPNDPTPASASFKGAGNLVPRKARHSCQARRDHKAKGGRHAKREKAQARCKRAKRGAKR